MDEQSWEGSLQIIVDLLVAQAEAYAVILFGSYGTGHVHSDSDIDIAFLGDKKLDSYEVFMLAQALACRVGKDVDLIDLQAASTVMGAQIISSGKILYCSDHGRRAEFFMRAFKEYALLNEEREGVLRAIERRGSVYGN